MLMMMVMMMMILPVHIGQQLHEHIVAVFKGPFLEARRRQYYCQYSKHTDTIHCKLQELSV
jgi:hypothetical protein